MKHDFDRTELAIEVYAVAKNIQPSITEDMCDENGTPCIDIRLQLVDGSSYVHTGDIQYDTDHRGSWGYGSVSPSMDDNELQELASEIVDDAIAELEALP